MPLNTDCPNCVWTTQGFLVTGFKPCDECRSNTLHDSHVDIRPAFTFHDRIRAYRMAVAEWEHGGRQGDPPTIAFPEATDDSKLPGFEWPVERHYCFRCNKDMRAQAYAPDVTFASSDKFDGSQELQNECNLIFTGGYGSFIDDLGRMPMLVLCHECGHELCDWLGVDPRNWHTHSIHGGQHPDHHDNRSNKE